MDRRAFLGAAVTVPLMGLTTNAAAAGECTVFDRTRQAATTPDQALDLLLEGNARFIAGNTINCDLIAQTKATSSGQAPFAAVVGCIDSRVPPELVFDQRIGDIFAVRIAGNFVDIDVIGSLEFATKVSGSKLIMILGHSECGAIKGAIDDVQLGNLTATLGNILPAVDQTTGIPGERKSSNAEFVQAVAETNARLAAALLLERSTILQELMDTGALRIVPAMYNVATGKVAVLA